MKCSSIVMAKSFNRLLVGHERGVCKNGYVALINAPYLKASSFRKCKFRQHMCHTKSHKFRGIEFRRQLLTELKKYLRCWEIVRLGCLSVSSETCTRTAIATAVICRSFECLFCSLKRSFVNMGHPIPLTFEADKLRTVNSNMQLTVWETILQHLRFKCRTFSSS